MRAPRASRASRSFITLLALLAATLVVIPSTAVAATEHCANHRTEVKVESDQSPATVQVVDNQTGDLVEVIVTIVGPDLSIAAVDPALDLVDASWCIKSSTKTNSGSGLTGHSTSTNEKGKVQDISHVVLYSVTSADSDTTLAIDKTGPEAVFAGQEIEFTIEVTNTGTEPAASVVVDDTLPTDGSFISSTPAGTLTAGVLTVALGNIAPGDSAILSILWQAPAIEATPVNTAEASADNAPAVSDDHSVQVGIKVITTGGVTAAGSGLRNRDNGDITITGVPAGAVVTRAVLTWALLYTDPVPSNQITFEGELITADLTQTTSSDLCWGDSNTIGFAADVTDLVAGNAVYAITDPVNGVVREDSNPGGTLPYTDGATLVVFYGGPGYDDQVLSDFTYSAESGDVIVGDNVRNLTGINSIGGTATLYIAGPDGQNNGGERVLITGVGTLNFDNSWDGSDPQEGPDFTIGNLWDTDIHDVTAIVPAAQTTLDINLGLGPDCTGISAVALQVEQ